MFCRQGGIEVIKSDGDWALKLGQTWLYSRIILGTAVIDTEDVDSIGRTALHGVATVNSPWLLRRLLAQKMSPNAVDLTYSTPLHYAVMYSSVGVVLTLLTSNSDINAVNYYGNTPLHNAARCKRRDIVDELLHRGAAANILNGAGQTYLDCLRE